MNFLNSIGGKDISTILGNSSIEEAKKISAVVPKDVKACAVVKGGSNWAFRVQIGAVWKSIGAGLDLCVRREEESTLVSVTVVGSFEQKKPKGEAIDAKDLLKEAENSKALSECHSKALKMFETEFGKKPDLGAGVLVGKVEFLVRVFDDNSKNKEWLLSVSVKADNLVFDKSGTKISLNDAKFKLEVQYESAKATLQKLEGNGTLQAEKGNVNLGLAVSFKYFPMYQEKRFVGRVLNAKEKAKGETVYLTEVLKGDVDEELDGDEFGFDEEMEEKEDDTKASEFPKIEDEKKVFLVLVRGSVGTKVGLSELAGAISPLEQVEVSVEGKQEKTKFNNITTAAVTVNEIELKLVDWKFQLVRCDVAFMAAHLSNVLKYDQIRGTIFSGRTQFAVTHFNDKFNFYIVVGAGVDTATRSHAMGISGKLWIEEGKLKRAKAEFGFTKKE